MSLIKCDLIERLQFFVHVVWLIGQYASASSDQRCNARLLLEFHEVSCFLHFCPCHHHPMPQVLDSLTYEVNALIQSRDCGVYKVHAITARMIASFATATAECTRDATVVGADDGTVQDCIAPSGAHPAGAALPHKGMRFVCG